MVTPQELASRQAKAREPVKPVEAPVEEVVEEPVEEVEEEVVEEEAPMMIGDVADGEETPDEEGSEIDEDDDED